jgi:hypothetical protein
MMEFASAATYHVDSQTGNDRNDGRSPKTAWKSLQKVNATVFHPGDRILFKAGTRYAGQLKPQGSGDRENGKAQPILVDRYGGDGLPRIDGEGKFEAAVHLYNAEYWEIRHLEVTNRGPKPQARRKGVFLQLHDFGTAHHVELHDLFVHDVNGSNVKEEGGGTGIEWHAGGIEKKSRFDGLLIENCRLERCDRNGIVGGGYWKRSEWFPSLRVVLRGNRLEDIGGDGIVPIACDGALVEKNVLRNGGQRVEAGQSVAGIWPWSCDNTIIQYNEVSGMRSPWDGQGFDSDWNCRNTIIQYNYSHDNEGGFLLLCNDGSQRKENSVGNVGTIIRYNLSVNDGHRTTGKRAGFSPVIHITGPSERSLIYNNTIVVRKRRDGEDKRLVMFDTWEGWANDTAFVNNLFYAEDEVHYDYGKATGIVFENNLYAGRHEHAPEDPRAIRKDPEFVHPSSQTTTGDPRRNYRLREGSPAIAAGLEIPNPGSHDLLGTPLPKHRPPSLGALEIEEQL